MVDVAPPGAPRKQRMRSGFDTKEAALEAMAELQRKAGDGRVVEPSKLTVGDYLTDQWLDAYRADTGVRESTWNAAEGHVRNHIVPYIGDVPIQRLNRTTIKGLYGRLRESGRVRGDGGLSEKTVHNVHLTLHRALEDAIEDRLIERNPAGKTRSGNALHSAPDRPEMTTWTAEELSTFLAAANGHRLAALYRLAAYSGMRRGELCGLRWRDVDLDASTVTINRQRVKAADGVKTSHPKTDRSKRTIDLDPATVAALADHRTRQLEERMALGLGKPSADGLVFTNETGDEGLHPDVVTQTFDRIVKASDLARIRLHDYAEVRVMPTRTRRGWSGAVNVLDWSA